MSNGHSIATLWQRLEAWASENAPEMLRDLNPGADDAAIDALENAFGHPLPSSYRESLRIHNGESDGWPNRVFADMGAYHSVDSAINDRDMYLKISTEGTEFDESEIAEQIENDIITVDGPVRPLTYSPGWLPIMNCNGDVFWALDFAPSEGGQNGQIIQVDLERCYWAVVGPDFGTFLEQYVSGLESGDYDVQGGLPTKDPRSDGELAVDSALADSISLAELEKLEPGAVVSIVGVRSGRARDDRCDLAINGGDVQLRGSLSGAKFNKVLRVTVRVGRPRGFGFLAPIHDILEWEVVD